MPGRPLPPATNSYLRSAPSLLEPPVKAWTDVASPNPSGVAPVSCVSVEARGEAQTETKAVVTPIDPMERADAVGLIPMRCSRATQLAVRRGGGV